MRRWLTRIHKPLRSKILWLLRKGNVKEVGFMHEYSKRIGEHIKSCYSDFNNMNREELDELKAWACVMKDLTEYDINKRGIEAMDEAEQEEKFYGRMGYRGRDSRTGRFVHRSGRGRSAGYTPYP